MKSPGEMSAMIRRKKKDMQDDPGVVDLSGIPMDKTDEDIMERDEMTKELGLDKNMPKDHSEEPAELTQSAPAPEHEEMSEDKIKRMARVAKMLAR